MTKIKILYIVMFALIGIDIALFFSLIAYGFSMMVGFFFTGDNDPMNLSKMVDFIGRVVLAVTFFVTFYVITARGFKVGNRKNEQVESGTPVSLMYRNVVIVYIFIFPVSIFALYMIYLLFLR